MEQDYDFLCKAVVVGDSGVGKSSIILRFSDGVCCLPIIARLINFFRLLVSRSCLAAMMLLDSEYSTSM